MLFDQPTTKAEVPGNNSDATVCSRCRCCSRFRFCLTALAAKAAIPTIATASNRYYISIE